MIRYSLKALVAHLNQGRSLFLLTVFGVALGVASVVAIQIVNHNAIGAFAGGIRAVSGEADLSVLGQAGPFSEELYAKALAVEGISAAWPLYRLNAAVAGRDSHLQILGVDLFSRIELPWQASSEELTDALFQPGWLAVSPALAQEMRWSEGDSFQVSSGTRRAELRIGALVDFQKRSPLASRRLAVMDISQVQHSLGRSGLIHQIDVQVRERTPVEEVARRLQEQLGPSVRVVTPEQREQQAEQLMSAFKMNLTALSLISLFVGVFVVYTSTQASLVRRRLEFGVLRSVGATRGQVLGLILGEILILGLVGVTIGMPLGYWVAQSSVDMVSSTLRNLYLLQTIEAVRVPPWVYFVALSIGLGGAAAGGFFPALDMSRRDTRSLLAAFTVHERVTSLTRPLFLLGCFLLAASALWYTALARDWKPAGFVLAVTVLFSLPLLTPGIIQFLCGQVSIREFDLRYSLKTLAVRLQTTAFAVASLAIAVSMLVGITLMIGSFRRTVEVWVSQTVEADIYISTESARDEGGPGIDDDLISALARYPAVAAVDPLRRLLVFGLDRQIALIAVDVSLLENRSRFPFVRGDRPSALRQVREQGAVLIGEPLANKAGLGVGDRLVLSGPRGHSSFTIAGVYYDYSSELGTAVLDLATMEKHFGPGPMDGVSLHLREGAKVEEMIDGITSQFPHLPLVIRSNQRLREEIFNVFDQTFAIVRILQLMSFLIAVSGITLTLLVMARERTSELALYRALGATRAQVFRFFMGKAIGMAVIGLAVGSLAGVMLAAILIFVINRAYFGWTIQVFWPGWTLAAQVLFILGVSALAGIYPALRASSTAAGALSRDDV